MVTNRQREIIYASGKQGENRKVVGDRLGIKDSTVRSQMTKSYRSFIEDLKLFDEHYDIFDNRFKKDPDAFKILRRIARKIKRR